MKLLLPAFFSFFLGCKEQTKVPADEEFIVHSKNIRDSFQIRIRKPGNLNQKDSFHLVYVADGSLGVGQYAIGSNPTWKAHIPGNCIIITIGHIGNYREKRRRDFIPSEHNKTEDENFGRADLFYKFLKEELIPLMNEKFPEQKERIFIGHSFSGLFCLYAALKNERLFDKYFAISPSVWANDHELLKTEEKYFTTHKDLDAEIHLYAGSLEVFNKVLSSTRKFHKALANRNYKSLTLSFDVIPNANHYSIRKPAIDRIMKELAVEKSVE